MQITDMDAYRKWKTLGKATQAQILRNVFCPQCSATKITNYSMRIHRLGISLEGKCAKCGGRVARLIEREYV